MVPEVLLKLRKPASPLLLRPFALLPHPYRTQESHDPVPTIDKVCLGVPVASAFIELGLPDSVPRQHLFAFALPRPRASTSTPRKDRIPAHVLHAAPVGSKQRQRRRGAGVRPRQDRPDASCHRRRHSNRKILSKLHRSGGARGSARMYRVAYRSPCRASSPS